MMGTRRPMNRVPSGNGRYYDSHGSSNGSTSDSEDSNGSIYTPRADSRSYLLNVRPENSRSSVSRYSYYKPSRTTFCSIISQLTEETQPCFETTLKPRAVSEGSDAKFICMVTGYPEPEITWYKDDEEMDRYCGLPKYEIFRNGKRHTLQIYKCTEEDAAIYQASARNNKGIVSCSGVLEVGTMTEYKIHQRWFAKLKRKAEAKMREIEQSRRKVRENLDESEKLRALSPERIQRKRRFSSENKDAKTEPKEKDESIKVHVPDPTSRLQDEVANTKEQPHNVVNGFHVMETEQMEEVTTNGYAVPENIEENGKEFLAYVYETVEVITKKSTPKESYAKKKKKEDEPPISTADLTKEETKQGTAKKSEGISPAPRRSRFGKDVAKTHVEEKMEVQTSPVSVNKRFAPSILSNKSAKSTVTKDLNKIKDNIVPSKKADDSSIPKPGHLQSKDDVKFSLKDLYFEDSPSQAESASSIDQVKKTKTEVQPDVSPTNPSVQGQIKVPKAAPRRTKEQRELSVGRKPPPTTTTKNEFPSSKPVSNLDQRVPDPKPKCEPPKPVVDNSTVSSAAAFGTISDAPEQKLKKVESEVIVAPSSSDIKLQKTNMGERSSPEERHELEHEGQEGSENNRISSEDPNEEKTRIETLKKLQNLETEYMALQKAYALLQKQLELSQQAEQAQKISKLSDGEQKNEQPTTDNNEGKNLEIPENTEKEVNFVKCPGSPEPVYMETDVSAELEVIPVPDPYKTGQNEQSQRNEETSSDSMMESSLEDGSNEKNGQTDDIEQMNTKKVSVVAKDVSDDSRTEQIAQTSEVEMLEDVKEEVTNETIERVDKPIVQDILVETARESHKLNPVSVAEENITETPNKVLNLDLSENGSQLLESSQLLPSDQTDQSVATLLRDVKKALESGVPSIIGSSVDPASSQSSMTSPNTEEEDEAERIKTVPQKENESSQELAVQEPTNTYQKDAKTEVDEPSSGISSTFHQENKEVEHDNISKPKEKQDHSLVTTLKNSLLMLLHIKTADVDKTDEKSQSNVGDIQPDSPEEMHSPQMSLSPPSPRKMYDYGKDSSDSPQSIQSMHSSSTSGKLTPSSEEDMVQNVDSLQTSPTIPRRIIEISKKEDIIPQVESAPQSPVAPKRSSKVISDKTVLSKEDLSFSPATSRRIAAKIASGTDPTVAITVPSIVVGSPPVEISLGSMLSDPPRDSSRKWRSTENLSLIPSATPEELASGARRKIYLNKTKQQDNEDTGNTDSLTPPSRKESPNVSPGLSRRNNSLLVTQSPPVERRSPGTIRRMAMLEVPKIYEEDIDKGKTDSGSQESKDTSKDDTQHIETKKINDPYKAPQVIRKIRAEQFSDASGNLKMWCQFFNVLSDSDITWYKDEIQVAKIKRSSGDEGQVALAIVQASAKDCGVYQCSIENEYGSDSTDCLLSAEILSGFITKEEVEVGEEIEMTPMVFAKGLADSGYWGDKFFGRIVMEDPHVGNGFLRKSCRVKVIYGLEPIFESGKTCIIKIRNLITFGTKNESTLVEKNYDITIQECKIQNTTREYCKIFAAECRGVPNFGKFPEILPLNLIYRPANNVPYATIEEDLEGRFEKYCLQDLSGKLHVKNSTEIEQKCCTFQHWVFQWTNGNFLVTVLEGVGWKLTNIGIATKSKGYQGLKESCHPEILEEFPSVHQCNSYCEMLSLKSLKATEGLQPPSKPKGSRSPQMGRKTASTQSSPQIQKKAMSSPQASRKGGVSPKSTRKVMETGDPQSSPKVKGSEGLTSQKPQ